MIHSIYSLKKHMEKSIYSNQFKNGETCSRIDGGHVKLFYNNVQSLVDIIKCNYRANNYAHDFTEFLLFLLLLCKCWTKVRIESKEQCLNEIDEHECNLNKFYKQDIDTTLKTAVRGDGEAFYCHCAKH